MSIGEVLHDARSQSGLTIVDVARQTGIVEETIWAIELDDFAKCGSDAAARRDISAIAAAVRVDPAPLIAEFDAAKVPLAVGRRSELLTLPAPNLPDHPRPLTRRERYKWRHRRRVALSTALCLIVLAIFGAEAYHFFRDVTPTETAGQAAYSQATTRPAPTTKPSHSAKPTPSATPSLTLRTLIPVSASGYGPSGPETGNPQIAAKAIDSDPSSAWQSKAYNSPDFDGQSTGTGVLLDLGHPVTVVSATISIGVPGAWVQLRGGTSDTPDALPVIGGTKDAGATTTIRPQQTPIRYLLIWFTTLPQTPIGNYQASIENITLQGHS